MELEELVEAMQALDNEDLMTLFNETDDIITMRRELGEMEDA